MGNLSRVGLSIKTSIRGHGSSLALLRGRKQQADCLTSLDASRVGGSCLRRLDLNDGPLFDGRDISASLAKFAAG